MASVAGERVPQIDLKARGLYTHPNALDLPLGAMLKATNVVIDKDNVVDTMRGTQKYGDTLANAPSKFFSYKSRLLVHHGSTLSYDSDGAGTWSDYSGSYDAPSGTRMRAARSQQNFYFTTDAGIKKLDALAGTVTDAGGIKAIDGEGSTTGTSGFMSDDVQVAYRIVWGIKDANDNLILGTPSQRIRVANSAGATRDVSLTFTIPDGVTTSHFYQIYRSGESASATDPADDELQLVIEDFPTAAEISAKSVTLTDNVPNDLRGATLYTSPSQQGIEQANDVPPLAKDVEPYKNFMLYANTQTRQRLFLTMVAVGSPNLFYYSTTGDTNSDDTLTNVASFTGLAVGQRISSSAGDIPAGTTITALDSGAGTITMSASATASNVGVTLTMNDRLTLDGVDYWAASAESVGDYEFAVASTGDLADDIENACLSLIRVINQNADNVYGFYLSNFDDLPGKLLIEDRTLGGSVWYATSSKGSSFNPVLEESGTEDPSSAEIKKNRIYVSKSKQPEAVPIGQYYDIGSEDEEILRVIALRDSAFIFKTGEDGIWRVTGDSIATLDFSPFDNTAVLRGAETAVRGNNAVWGYSDQGVMSVSDNGVQVWSRPVEIDLLKKSSDLFPDFDSIAWGTFYETERKYIVGIPTATSDTYATQQYVFNTFTSSWTRWERNWNYALIADFDGRLYAAQGDANNVRKERKSFTVVDYADDEYAVTISAFSGTTVTVNSTASAAVGQTLAQVAGDNIVTGQAKVTEVTDGTHLEVDRVVVWDLVTPAAKLYDPIATVVEWAPIHGGDPSKLKQFPELIAFFRDAAFQSIDFKFQSNFSEQSVETALQPTQSYAWGAGPWGGGPWGGSTRPNQPIRTYVPLDQQRAHWLKVSVEHSEALTNLGIEGMTPIMNPMDTHFVGGSRA